jgi:hypothetical protein
MMCTADRLVGDRLTMLRWLPPCAVLALAIGPADADTPPRDGSHDFDFEIETWKTHLRRLQHPPTASATWLEYDATSTVRKIATDTRTAP